MKKEKSILVVLGMHRSGTSVVTRIFNLLGADPGENLMLPAGDNPTGFWEMADIVEVHDELLRYLGYSWDDPRPLPYKWWTRSDISKFEDRLYLLAKKHYSDKDQPIIKDPRMCRLLPIWQKIFKKLEWEPSYILVGRSPLEVASSLSNRNGLAANHSYLLWLRYVIESEQWSRGNPRVFLLYDQLFSDWNAEIKRCNNELNLNRQGFSESQKDEISELIDSNLRHNWAEVEAIDTNPELSLFVADVFHGFKNVATGCLHGDDLETQFESIDCQLAAADNLYSSIWLPCFKQRDTIAANAEELRQKNDAMKIDLERYQGGVVVQQQLEVLINKFQASCVEAGQTKALKEELGRRRKEHIVIKGVHEQRIDEKASCTENLNKSLTESNRMLDSLGRSLTSFDGQLASLNQTASTRDEQLAILNQTVSDRDEQLAILNQTVSDRDEQLAILSQTVSERDGQVANLNKIISDYDVHLDDAQSHFSNVEKYAKHLDSEIKNKNAYIKNLEDEMSLMRGSVVWKVTIPFKFVGRLIRGVINRFSRIVLNIARFLVNIIPIQDHAKYSIKRRLLTKLGKYFIWLPSIRNLYAQHAKPYVYTEKTNADDIKIAFLVDKVKSENEFSLDKKDYDQFCKEIFDDFLRSESRLIFPSFKKVDVSIALIFYNRVELSFACLVSILDAEIKNYELIIVDNGSADRTPLLLNKLSNVKLIKNDTNKGFVEACNQASRKASGDYLLLLNNDTLVVPGSIESSLSILKNDPDVGAVGARIINLDGKLQEAGSYMFRDGGCAGYGRGQSPYSPEFMYQRSVDYCSGAYLMTPMKLFNKLGGVDEKYSPAYYEESDYCVRLIKDNKKIIYDSDSVIIHYEFASSESVSDAIELQRKNRKLFVSKHDDFLSTKSSGESHCKYVSRSNEKPINRILFIDDRVPHKYYGSGFPRSNKIVNFLDALDYFVTVFPLRFPYEEKSWNMVYEDISKNIEVMRNNGIDELPSFLKDRKGYYDVIFVSRPHNMELINEYIEEGFLTGDELIIYDAEALFSLRDIVEKKLKGIILSDKEQKKMIDDEMSIAKNAEKIITVSNQEKAVYIDSGFEKVHILGHGVTINPTLEKFNCRKDILFVGAIHACHSPNADSLIWFVKEVFPLIKSRMPDVRLNIVGFNLCDQIDDLQSKDIVVHGQVDDLYEFYNNNKIFIAPTRYAAGIPMKVHHAAGYGLPCVVTEILRDQLGWEDGASVMSANPDSPDLFAEKCIDLYSNQGLWETIREGALCKIEEECSDEIFKSNLRLALET